MHQTLTRDLAAFGPPGAIARPCGRTFAPDPNHLHLAGQNDLPLRSNPLARNRPPPTFPPASRQTDQSATRTRRSHDRLAFRKCLRPLRIEVFRTRPQRLLRAPTDRGPARPDLATGLYSGNTTPDLAICRRVGRIRGPCDLAGSGASHVPDLAAWRDSGWHRKTVVSRYPGCLATSRIEASCDAPPGLPLHLAMTWLSWEGTASLPAGMS